MSGFTTGLTRIKNQEVSPIKSFQEQQQQGNPIGDRGLKAIADVAELTRIKDDLAREIDELYSERNKTYKQVTSEISVLNKQKSKFLNEIKVALKTLSLFRDARSRGETSFNDFFEGREDVLIKFASLVSSKLDNQAKLINLRSERLQKEESLAEEMNTYSENLLGEAYNRLSEADKAKLWVRFEAKRISELKISVERNSRKTTELLNLAESKFSNAAEIESLAHKILRKSKVESKKILDRVGRKTKTFHLRELGILTREKLINNKLKTGEENIIKTLDRLSKEIEEARKMKAEADKTKRVYNDKLFELGKVDKKTIASYYSKIKEADIKLKEVVERLKRVKSKEADVGKLLEETSVKTRRSDKEIRTNWDRVIEAEKIADAKLGKKSSLLEVQEKRLSLKLKDFETKTELLNDKEMRLEEHGKKLENLRLVLLAKQVEVKRILSLKESLERESGEASHLLRLAKSKFSNAAKVEANAREFLNVAVTKARLVIATANKKARIVDLKALKVLEKEKYFKTWEDSLSKTERKLKDKEETLKRNAERVRQAAIKVGMSGII